MLGSVSVNDSLTIPRCKNCTSKCGEDKFECTSPAWDVWGQHCSYSPQGDDLHQGGVGSLLGSEV